MIYFRYVNEGLVICGKGFTIQDPARTYNTFYVDINGGSTFYAPLTSNLVSQSLVTINLNPTTNTSNSLYGNNETGLHISGPSIGSTIAVLDNYGANGNIVEANTSSSLYFRRFRGTPTLPTAVKANDAILIINATAYDGTSIPNYPQTSSIIIRSTEDQSSNSKGTQIEFNAIPKANSNSVNLLTLDPSGVTAGLNIPISGTGVRFPDTTFQTTAYPGTPVTSVTSNNYTANVNDYYIGINSSSPSTVNLPSANNGKLLIVKDESGHASINPITIQGNIDNDTSAILQIDNAALTLIYSNGWRII